MFNLDDRVAIVTGANTGLGQAIAIALAEAGADIALVGRSSMDETAAQIAALGRKSLAIAPTWRHLRRSTKSSNARSDGVSGSTYWSTTPASFAAPTRST
jgi:NAD(P)-dependent dehydrogenase (short-subunit alcohol dehydrogenase family)